MPCARRWPASKPANRSALVAKKEKASRPRRSGGFLRSGVAAGSAEVLAGEVPVDKVGQGGLDVLRAGVAVIDVVRVLPHVERQQRLLLLLEWQFGVAGL